MSKEAQADHPIHQLITKRWSPYGYGDRPISEEDLAALFEAARWAASAYNEQPWRFIVARSTATEEHEKLLSCLVEPNRDWAKAASVLVLCVVSQSFARNGKANRTAAHDLGLAAGNLSLEATARGLSIHQMSGILPEVARETYQIPEGYEATTALTIGYPASPEHAQEPYGERDAAPRTRKPLAELVFEAEWGRAAALKQGPNQ